MRTVSSTIALLLLAPTMHLGCASEPPPASEASTSSTHGWPRASDDKLAERMRIAASGERVVQSQPRSNLLAPAWDTGLDLPPGSFVAATLTGPSQAADVFPNLGVIKPIKGNSFVILSTGYANLAAAPTDPKGPEPGYDFAPAGVQGDTVTLTLDLRVPRGANKMSLQYNFLSSESPDFVGSPYNDTFSVRLTEGAGPTRAFELASVNSSEFFDASTSRAGNSGYDIYTVNPQDVDSFPDPACATIACAPDAGLTDFQSAHFDVTGGTNLKVELTITDQGDGILDSSVLIDAIQFTAIETVDPNPALVTATGSLTADLDQLTTAGRPVRGVITDGATELLLRIKVPAPGDVTFSILGPNPASDGWLRSLDNVDERLATVVTPSVSVLAGGEYALAMYRAPADFFDGDDPRIERSIQIGATGPNGFATEVELQLRRPPVVLAHGLWASTTDWLKSAITADPRFEITYADRPYACDAELRVELPADGIPRCAWTVTAPPQGFPVCLAERTNKIGEATKEALERIRILGLAASQVHLVAHGSRGLHARQYINSPDYKKLTYLEQGDVNRLITINTPHFGTPAVDKIVAYRDGLATADLDYYQCTTRWKSLYPLGTPVEKGDLDELKRSNGLEATAVPSHAIIGTGGKPVASNTLTYRTKIGAVNTVVYGPALFNPKSPTAFNGLDHDLFTDVDSQKGGLPGAEMVTPLVMSSLGDVDDSDFFHSLRDPRLSSKLTELLRTPIVPANGAPRFGQFQASPRQPLRAEGMVPESLSANGPSLLPANARLRIVSPADRAQVLAGSTITVQVVAENFVPASVLAMAGSATAVSTTAPFTTQLRIPPEALGPISLLAAAYDANDDVVLAQDVVLIAKTHATIDSLSIVTQDPILFGLGTKRQLTVVGRYNDGNTRDITSSATGTLYRSSNPYVVTVSSNGTLTSVGSGIATVVAQNGGVQDSITVTVKGNSKPRAVASAHTSMTCVEPGAQVPVQLDASSSIDPDGDPLEFSWFIDDVVVASGPTPTIGLGGGDYLIELQVSDGQGGFAHASVSISILEDPECGTSTAAAYP